MTLSILPDLTQLHDRELHRSLAIILSSKLLTDQEGEGLLCNGKPFYIIERATINLSLLCLILGLFHLIGWSHSQNDVPIYIQEC